MGVRLKALRIFICFCGAVDDNDTLVLRYFAMNVLLGLVLYPIEAIDSCV